MISFRGTKNSKRKGIVCRILVTILIVSAFFMLSCSSAFLMVFRRMPPPDLGLAPTYETIDSALYPHEDIRFLSGENTLSGCWFPAENSKGTVLIVHGFGSSGEAHLPETMYFVDHGFSVFTFDATGMGSSEGNRSVGFSQSTRDVICAADYLRKNLPESPLFLYGHSMGGYGVLTALAEIDVDGAVCLNGFRTPVSLMYSSARRYVGILADLSYPFLALQHRLHFGPDGNADALDSAIRSQTPVLILNGNADTIVPDSAKLSPGDTKYENIEFCTVDGGHSGIWLSEDSEMVNEPLMDLILEFYLSVQ